jgi:hypothetical protein
MAIQTEDELKEYIKRQLGYPSVNVEVTDDQLSDVIGRSIKEFSEFAYDGELVETVSININGAGTYVLPSNIMSIAKVSQGNNSIGDFDAKFGTGFVPDYWTDTMNAGMLVNGLVAISNTRATLNKFFGDDLYYDFNQSKSTLRIFEDYSGLALIEYTKEYIPDAVDKIYNQSWVQDMSVAQARLIQARVTGKFDQSIVGGATINHGDMRAEAEAEIEYLKEKLISTYAGPAGIWIA